ncbi:MULTISPECIES: hypothetical protein [Fusobacterium]|jgi:hypothetical protein|uniref:DUF3592 domain-containing protein n=1 Tax=Fusobacterium varium ATCC 27725 TaxID=469618 RepID=A0ABM6U6M2_FUSVA|nr:MULTISPECIES: hypothetical protein [Fusobacterium]AVQ32040.1 hypothetical protein C4N18_12705 [Fusobacterium varium ATCC 27725]EES63401.1 hypothetical protein FVAG_01090 [Fusobacterium varium ATCC 27725]MCF2673473.1 hypothetical protein [Fusobacterium varium]RHG36423.1 hypothetical protein DW261_06110 [Fusobacterium varium]VEH39081.1 Uncharacterised protein [Fusobacterium varium]
MGAGFALIIAGLWLMMKKSKIEGETYKATIVGITKFDRYYIMKFECDGEIIEAKTIEGGLVNSKDKIGEEIEIEYNKENPEVCSIKGANRGYILIIAGIIFILFRTM